MRITPTEHPEAVTVPEGNLTITPFTEVRAELVPPILALLAWGDRWEAGDDGPPARVRHRPCGHETTATVVCSHLLSSPGTIGLDGV